MSADPIDDAKEFFRYSNLTDSLQDVVNSDAPLKIGVDMENKEILIGVHDKMFFMDLEMAAATLHALYLAVRTLEAQLMLSTEVDYSADDIYNGGNDD
jgi:hypothetical protein